MYEASVGGYSDEYSYDNIHISVGVTDWEEINENDFYGNARSWAATEEEIDSLKERAPAIQLLNNCKSKLSLEGLIQSESAYSDFIKKISQTIIRHNYF